LPRLQYRVADPQCPAPTPYCKPHAKKMAANTRASILYRKITKCPAQFATIILARAYTRSTSAAGTRQENQRYRTVSWKAATAFNGGIGKIAALPHVDNFYILSRRLLVLKVYRLPQPRQYPGTLRRVKLS